MNQSLQTEKQNQISINSTQKKDEHKPPHQNEQPTVNVTHAQFTRVSQNLLDFLKTMPYFNHSAYWSSSSGKVAVTPMRIFEGTLYRAWGTSLGWDYNQGSSIARYLGVVRPLFPWNQACATGVCRSEAARCKGYMTSLVLTDASKSLHAGKH